MKNKFLKIVLLGFITLSFNACGFKSLVIPHVDWIITRNLSAQMALNSDQKNELRKDITKLLEDRKPQATRINQYLKSINVNNIQVDQFYGNAKEEYKDLLKAFLPIYSKHLANLNEGQLTEFEKSYKEKNKEIKEQLADYDDEKLFSRFENNIGSLTDEQEKLLKAEISNFKKVQENRLERRIQYQKSVLEILKKKITAKEKQKEIYKLSWDYNTQRRDAETQNKNVVTTQKVFSSLNKDQKEELQSNINNYSEWISYFISENYQMN